MVFYPSALARFATHRDSDVTDLAVAAHVNDLQDEVTALQQYIGTNPAAGYPDVAARIARGARVDLVTVSGGQQFTARSAGWYRASVTWVPRAVPRSTAVGYRLLVGGVVIAGRALTEADSGALPRGGQHVVRLLQGASLVVTGVALTASGTAVPVISVRRVAG